MADLTSGDDVGLRATAIARSSYGRLVALLASRSRDLAAAEDALADAFERALRRWPIDGVPDNPEAWLLTVARNRDRDRRRSAAHRQSAPLHTSDRATTDEALDQVDPDAIPDRRLALLFVCTHPAIDRAVRTPLMLQVVLGFSAEQIARAYALPASTMAQRLVRAKRRIRDAGIPFVVPELSATNDRLTEVLEAVYGAFAIDWNGIAGVTERELLASEALLLAETLAEVAPGEPEVLGLASLVCLSLARAPARVDGMGVLVPLDEQDPNRWIAQLIDRGEAYLRHAHELGRIGRFQLEAAIQSVHCARRMTGTTDWHVLHQLHTALARFAPTLGSKVSLAVTTAELEGPSAGLAVLDAIDGSGVERFQPAWVARAHLLARAGDRVAAAAAYDKAISLTTDLPARAHLQRCSLDTLDHS